MSAATKRNAPQGLDRLDSEARAAVRKAARHAGMSLEEWLAAVSAGRPAESAPAPARKRAKRAPQEESDELDTAVAKLQAIAKLARKPAGIAAEELEHILARAAEATERRTREHAAKTAVALDSVADWIEQAEQRLHAASRGTVERQERTAAIVGEALGAMARRLDDIERKLGDERQPGIEAALKAVERIETQLAKSNSERDRRADEAIGAALRGFEARMAELGERFAARKAAAPRADMRSAVAEIRARQAELDAGEPAASDAPAPAPAAAASRSHRDILHSLRGDIARLAGQLDTLRPQEPSREATALRAEIERLQAMVGGLATREEIKLLERSLHGIAAQVAQARAPADVAAFSRPVGELEGEIRRVADLVATGIHGRLSRDLDELARKIDAAATHGLAPAVVDGLEHQLTELRRLLAQMAEPQQIQELAGQVAELNGRLAELGRRQLDADTVERRFDALARRLDDIGVKTPESAIAERIDALSQKLDRLAEKPRITFAPPSEGIETLVQRLDRLDEALSRGSAPQLGPIEDMLRTLVERVDQAERPGAGLDALDSLEKQVAVLARRLELGSSDPALAGLERTMGDLMAQVELMRSGAHDAAERAAKAAVADTLAALPSAAAGPQIGSIKRDLDELKTHQSTADKRMQMTLESVHAALEKVVGRLASLEQDGSGEAAPRRPGAERPQTARVKAPVAAARTPLPLAEAAPDLVLDEADRPLPPASEEVLLEPGAARPRAAAAPAVQAAGPAAEPAHDIKANFIAAARRAAQAAAAEAAANAKDKGRDKRARGDALPAADAAGAKAGLAARLKAAADKHRRPILLGLAAIVLALGAIQAVGRLTASPPPTAPAPAAESRAAPAAPAPERQGALDAPAAPAAEPAPEARPDEPRTTQAIPAAEPAKAPPPGPLSDSLDGRPGLLSAGVGAKPPSMILPPAARIQALPAANAADPRPPVARPIPNVASAGELPSAPGLAGLRQAALSGDPAAVYEMAARLAEGRGVARDLKLAAKLFEKAAANGLVPAQYRIGNQYEKGLGVTRDVALAKGWYRRAAEAGNARAMHNLAVLLAEGGDGKPDYAGAAEWFRKAAEHGVKDSQFNLAVLLARGLGVAQDLVQSYTWFALVAAQGDDDAAKKRDDVAGRLASADLAAAKAAAERFKPLAAERAANEVALPAQGWAEPAPSAAPKPPASAQRPSAAGKRV